MARKRFRRSNGHERGAENVLDPGAALRRFSFGPQSDLLHFAPRLGFLQRSGRRTGHDPAGGGVAKARKYRSQDGQTQSPVSEGYLLSEMGPWSGGRKSVRPLCRGTLASGGLPTLREGNPCRMQGVRHHRDIAPIISGMHIHPSLSEVMERAFTNLMPRAVYHAGFQKGVL